MAIDRAGQVVVVTGGGSGMGQLAVQNFSRQGARVAALDINRDGLAATSNGCDGVTTWAVDISDFSAIKETVAAIESQIGPIDAVYNAAAIMPFGRVLEHDNMVQHKVMEINYGGLINIAQATLPAMVARGHGDFVSFASSAGLLPTLLTGAYSASKAAVAYYTEILYHENINSGVRFACVCPVVVKTPLLQQAIDTVWPKMLDSGEPLQPQQVLDDIEVALEKGDFWVFSGKGAKIGAIMRRLLPNMIWRRVHQVEGF